MRSSVNRIALGTIIGEQPWREMLAADKAKVIDLPPILSAQIDLYNCVHTRSTRNHRPMLGDYAWSCGSWSLYSATGNIPMALSEAIIATYMTIHMARSPGSHSGRIGLLARSSGRERKSCGCGFQATKARIRFVQRAYPPCQRHRDAGVALARARTPP